MQCLRMHVRMPEKVTHTCHTQTQTYTNAKKHTHIQTHTNTHIHTHKHTHKHIRFKTLTQVVTSPTRSSADGVLWTCLRLTVLTLFSMQKQPILYQIIFCVTTTLNLQPPCATKQFVTYYNYQKADWPGLWEALHATQLMDAISGTNKVNGAWAVWKEMLRELIIRYIPLSTVTIRPKNKPWMTSHLHHLSRAKHRLFKLAKRSKQPSDWLNYVRYRNFSNTEFKKAKRQYMSFI